MLELQFDFKNDKQFAEAFSKAPHALYKHLRSGISRAGSEVARKEKELAPKAHSPLVNSIRSKMESSLSAIVKPHVDYAAAVEYDSKPGGRPPIQVMHDWIRVKGITPDNPSMDKMDLAYVISRSIAQKGTEGQPFAAPTLENKRNRVETLLNLAVRHALNEVGL